MSENLSSGRLCVSTKKWWLLPGSNQRPVDYDSIALPTELSSQPKGVNKNGSGSRTRTCDRVVNSHLLYRLSYAGASMIDLIYPDSGKNQACFEEKTEKTGD